MSGGAGENPGDGDGLGGVGNSSGSGGSSPGACGDFEAGTEVRLCTATYLGSGGPDEIVGVGLTQDGGVIVGGNFDDAPARFADVTASGSGPGLLLYMRQRGRVAESNRWLDGRILAFGVDQARSSIVVATGSSLSRLSADLRDELWRLDLSFKVTKIAVSEAGVTGLLDTGGGVHLIDDEGSLSSEFTVSDPDVRDLALSPDGLEVFVVGAHPATAGGCQGNVPFLRKYDESGGVLSRAYDFDDPDGNCASSAGRSVSWGKDGKLYYAGENQGGNTVHLWDPRDLATPAPLVSYDVYNQGYGMAIQSYAFIARFDPAELTMETGHFLLPRDADESGGQLLVDDLSIDEEGRIALVGRATCCLQSREDLRVAGQAVGDYVQSELSVTLFASDFRERLSWFSTTRVSTAPILNVSMDWFDGDLIVGTTVPSGTQQITWAALEDVAPGEQDGYFLTMPAP